MSTPSPLCNVNGSSTINGVNVSTPSTVTVALASPAGVGPWTLTCVGTDELNTTAAVNASLTISQVTYTATFPAPAAGSALRFQSQVNGGINSNGVVDPTLTTTLTVYALTGNGYRVCAFGETMEGSAAFGWLSTLNPMLRNAMGPQAGAGAGLNYIGGVYSVGQNADNSIVVNAHDIQLKTSFTTLLNGATSAATASTLVERDGSGNCAFDTVTVAAAALSSTGSVGSPQIKTTSGTSANVLWITTGASSNSGQSIGISAGAGAASSTGGNVIVSGGNGTSAQGGYVQIQGGASGSSVGNIALGVGSPLFGGAANVVWIPTIGSAVPYATGANTGILYAVAIAGQPPGSQAGDLYWHYNNTHYKIAGP
jgi:hypothetical protein